MRKRISVLVAIGFAFLLGLGVLTSLAMIAGLRETMTRAEASQASALEVRAAVRSLRADYLASGDATLGDGAAEEPPPLAGLWTAPRSRHGMRDPIDRLGAAGGPRLRGGGVECPPAARAPAGRDAPRTRRADRPRCPRLRHHGKR